MASLFFPINKRKSPFFRQTQSSSLSLTHVIVAISSTLIVAIVNLVALAVWPTWVAVAASETTRKVTTSILAMPGCLRIITRIPFFCLKSYVVLWQRFIWTAIASNVSLLNEEGVAPNAEN